MLRIRDPKVSLNFYVNLMGMRTVFTMNVGPFTIYYLGYPQTEEHRADLPKFGLDTATNLQSTLGLLELYHVHGSEKQDQGFYQTGNTAPNLGFGHVGFTVPSVPKALERLKANGVEVLKDLAVSNLRSIPISAWENEQGIGLETMSTETEIHPEYKKVFDEIAFVKDPVSPVHAADYYSILSRFLSSNMCNANMRLCDKQDGYIVELVPQNIDPLDP